MTLSSNRRANPTELGLLNTQRPQTDGTKLKTDTVLNDETSEIERDLCAFGSGGGGVTQLLSNSTCCACFTLDDATGILTLKLLLGGSTIHFHAYMFLHL